MQRWWGRWTLRIWKRLPTSCPPGGEPGREYQGKKMIWPVLEGGRGGLTVQRVPDSETRESHWARKSLVRRHGAPCSSLCTLKPPIPAHWLPDTPPPLNFPPVLVLYVCKLCIGSGGGVEPIALYWLKISLCHLARIRAQNRSLAELEKIREIVFLAQGSVWTGKQPLHILGSFSPHNDLWSKGGSGRPLFVTSRFAAFHREVHHVHLPFAKQCISLKFSVWNSPVCH